MNIDRTPVSSHLLDASPYCQDGTGYSDNAPDRIAGILMHEEMFFRETS
jgi:hypothetical protein